MKASRGQRSATDTQACKSRSRKDTSSRRVHVLSARASASRRLAPQDKLLPTICSDLSSDTPVTSRELDAIEIYLALVLDALFDQTPTLANDDLDDLSEHSPVR